MGYLKQLSIWLKITETPKKKQGLAIMTYVEGKLKHVVDAMEEDAICAENGGEPMYVYIKAQYQHHLDKRLLIALDRALYSKQAFKYNGENMLEDIARKTTLYTELDSEKCVLPPDAKSPFAKTCQFVPCRKRTSRNMVRRPIRSGGNKQTSAQARNRSKSPCPFWTRAGDTTSQTCSSPV